MDAGSDHGSVTKEQLYVHLEIAELELVGCQLLVSSSPLQASFLVIHHCCILNDHTRIM